MVEKKLQSARPPMTKKNTALLFGRVGAMTTLLFGTPGYWLEKCLHFFLS